MIGRLLSTAASTFGREGHQQRGQQLHQAQQLESVTEEAHTRALLYPDPHALRISQHSAIPFHAGQVPATPRDAANYDDRGGLDVNGASDVRIIIAQDANLRYPPQVLFDSKPGRPGEPSIIQELGSGGQPHRQQHQHNRGKSLSSPQKTVQRPSHHHTATDLAGPSSSHRPTEVRRPSFFGSGHGVGLQPGDIQVPEAESLQARLAREKEELDALLNCIFGSPGMRLESGTKLHVLPRNFPHAERSSSSRLQRPFSPTGRGSAFSGPRGAGGGRNASASSDVFRTQTPHTVAGQYKTAIMITKLFNVQIPETQVTESETVLNGSQAQGSSTSAAAAPTTTTTPSKPVPSAQDDEPRRVKQKKTPMYAVAIIIHLPADPFPRTRSNPIPGMTPIPTPHQMSVPNSPRSTIIIPSFAGPENRPSMVPAADPMSSWQISQILGQWPLISRNIRLLEITAQSRLRHLLEKIVPLAPLPIPSQGKAGNVKLRRPKPPSQQPVYVAGEALQEDMQIRRQAEDSASNIALGLRARRVVPGQGRWGAWREEARWVSRWTGSREQNFFFLTFITAFLGQHTSWCEHAAPPRLGRRARKLRRFGDEDAGTLARKTVIVCNDKMAARRLVFLAASFLPGNLKTNPPAFSRADFSTPVYSESPPPMLSTTPKDQQPQPRRTAMRRDSPGLAQADGQAGHVRSVSFSVAHAPETPTEEEDRMSFGEALGRRASEAGSVRSTFTNLPASTREATKAASSTGQADSSIPVAHFSSLSPEPVKDPFSPPRPGSNGSAASAALSQAIRRSESSTTGSASSLGRFGSMMSGMWSAAPDSTHSLSSNDTGLPASGESQKGLKPSILRGSSTSGMRPTLHSPNKLSSMVEEISHLQGSPRPTKTRQPATNASSLGRSPVSQRLDLEFCLKKPSSSTDKTLARSIPRSEPDRMDLTMQHNKDEGFVDVSMLNDKSIESSLASSFASLRVGSFGQSFPFGSGTTTWNSSADFSEHQSPYGSPSLAGTPAPKPDAPPNVAGWLNRLHPDFTLQAVRTYPGLDLDIRQCLENEAKLCTDPERDAEDREDEEDDMGRAGGNEEEWTDLCSILVSDATRYVVEKHTLQRRKKRAHHDDENHDHASASSRQGQKAQRDHASLPFVLSPSSSVASLPDPGSEDQIIVEPIMEMDPTLTDAIDRVLAQSGPSSRAVSRVASRAPSPTRSRPVSVKSSTVQNSPQNSSVTKQDQLKTKDQMSLNTVVPSQSVHEGNRTLQNVPFPECRKIIMGALEEVVKIVIEERDSAHSGEVSDRRKPVVLTGPGIDGSLREGVARWLAQIEDTEDNHQRQ